MAGKGPGRQLKFTAKRQKIVLEMIRAGSSQRAAVGAAAIGISTLHKHLRRGEEGRLDRNTGETLPPDEPYITFAQKFREAQALAEQDAVQAVVEGFTGYTETRVEEEDGETKRTVTTTKRDWKAAAFWLERRRKTEWMNTKKVENTGSMVQEVVIHDGPAMDQKALKAAAEELEAEDKAGGGEDA